MENNNDIIELLDILYGMVTEAWGVPLGNDKCIIERDKAVEIINEIKDNLPSALAEAKRLVAARDEFIGNAKREAEAMRKSAEEKSRAMIEEQEIVRIARAKSAEMISSAESKSNELRRVASEYVDEMMRQTENNVSEVLTKLQTAHNAFRTMGSTATSNTAAKTQPGEVRQPVDSTKQARPTQAPPASTAQPQKRQGATVMKITREN
jgi:Skp family chaperone for outer membrane proteins